MEVIANQEEDFDVPTLPPLCTSNLPETAQTCQLFVDKMGFFGSFASCDLSVPASNLVVTILPPIAGNPVCDSD